VRGSGIGLAVVDEIVTALDGSVDIQSEWARTTVTVRLPLYKRPAPSGAPPRGGTAGFETLFPASRACPRAVKRCPAFGPGADNLLMHRPQKGNPIEQQK
jgi:hypothetical protein